LRGPDWLERERSGLPDTLGPPRARPATGLGFTMKSTDAAIGVFADHTAAEAAIKKLTNAGFAMKQLSLIGKGYHTEEKVIGFYNTGDRMKFWGSRGAFWGGLWGLFFGGVFLAVPVIGHVIVLGYLAAAVISAVEGAVIVGGLSALGAALVGIGVPKDSVISYETAIAADGFLVVVHGDAAEVQRGREILGTSEATQIKIHSQNAAETAASL